MKKTITASVLVLLSSLGLGLATGFFAHKMGSESLKGVKSPTENPSQKIADSKIDQEVDLSTKKDFEIIPEKKIIVNVYDYVTEQRELSKGKKKK